MTGTVRLPWAPLAVAIAHPDATLAEYAELLRVTPRTVARWQHDGVPLPISDRAACTGGWHPATVWPIEWEREWTAADDRHAAAYERKLAANTARRRKAAA